MISINKLSRQIDKVAQRSISKGSKSETEVSTPLYEVLRDIRVENQLAQELSATLSEFNAESRSRGAKAGILV